VKLAFLIEVQVKNIVEKQKYHTIVYPRGVGTLEKLITFSLYSYDNKIWTYL